MINEVLVASGLVLFVGGTIYYIYSRYLEEQEMEYLRTHRVGDYLKEIEEEDE